MHVFDNYIFGWNRNDGLQSFIENFVKDQFLPIVYVDYRTRVADALASKISRHPLYKLERDFMTIHQFCKDYLKHRKLHVQVSSPVSFLTLIG